MTLEETLRAQPTSWLQLDQRRFLRLGGPLGACEVFFDAGSVYSHKLLTDWATKAALDKAVTSGATPTPIPADTLAMLERGERAYLELRARLATGTAGWKIHTELLVIEVDGGLYNTAFSGDVATSYTKFAETGERALRDEQLTRATLGTSAAAVHDVAPARHQSLQALIARLTAEPEVLLAALERGELELVGGGPTSDQFWSLAFDAGQFSRRSWGETETCSREEVRELLVRRRYHTVHWKR